MADSLKSARSVDNSKSIRGRAQRHGTPCKRIIRVMTCGGREWQYHATKGWRNYRA